MKQKPIDKIKYDFKVIQDTREQTPWRFEGGIIQTIPAGDYTIGYQVPERFLTYEHVISVERKSAVSELYSASGTDRERFENELEKLSKLQYKFVICEFTMIELLNDAPPGRLDPKVVFGSIHAWMIKFNVPFIFAGTRQNARASALKIFEMFFKHKILGAK